MAALQESRGQDEWSDQPAAVADASESVAWDYAPSVPHRPKETVPAGPEDAEPAEPVVESRYRRNSAKLPRIGVEASQTSSAMANLRKTIVQDD